MFNPKSYENSRPDGIGVLEIVNGKKPGKEEPRLFVPLKRTELKGQLIGPLASLRLVQTYGYSREQCDKVLEAVYRYPLPGDAAVTAVRVCFGEVEIRAELKEREQAQKDYAQAKQEGRQAALATRESPDVFTLQVAGLQPDQDITVETCYVQLARAEGAGWSLRLPLTTAPRYVRSDEATSRHARGQPLRLLRDPGHRFGLDVTFPGSGAVSSSTHQLDVTRDGQRLHVRLREGEVVPDRDCVLSWRPVQEPDRPALQVLLHDDRDAGLVYFLALVAPPAVRDWGRGVPREIVLLVDHSGSMQGAKWRAADWAVERFLSDLTERDQFALGLFHNTTQWFAQNPRAADSRTVQEAVQFLKLHRDSGGTELGVALEQALELERGTEESACHVLLITDAQVSDEGRILRLASEEAKRAQRRRISLLCIDAAPNSFLATELAERGGGLARFLTSAPEEEDITTALDEILADWAEPVLAGLRLEINRPQTESAARPLLGSDDAPSSAIDLGDLPAGRSVWVAGRAARGGAPDLVLRVATARGREVAACRLDLNRDADARPAIKALFGARRVLGLEFLIHSGYTGDDLRDGLRRLGYDPERVLAGKAAPTAKVYAENVRDAASAALRDLLVREALDYGLACSETAFVAVRTESGKPIDGTVAVANALPADWPEESLFAGTGGAAFFISGAASLSALSTVAAAPSGGRIMRKAKGGFARARGAIEPSEASASPPTVLFSGPPSFIGSDAVLFDSSRPEDAGKLPDQGTFERLEVHFPDGAPDPTTLDSGLSLLVYVDDAASPRARARLIDLVRQRGVRPLHLTRQPGQLVRLVLVDPAGAWSARPPRLEVAVGFLRH